MTRSDMPRPSRRAFLRACLTMPAALVLAACSGEETPQAAAPTAAPVEPTAPPTQIPPTAAPTQIPPTQIPPTAAPTQIPPTAAPTQAPAPTVVALPPTPACGDDDDEPTPAQTEGPYFTPNSPERNSLIEAGLAGTRLTVTGVVVDTQCQPVARALLDFWQADDAGAYDNQGYRLRGHLFSDDQGRFSLETIVPGLYPGRTRHIHVKVQAPGGPVLTTQLYFPGEPANANDGIYRPELEMALQETADGRAGEFTFVLEAV